MTRSVLMGISLVLGCMLAVKVAADTHYVAHAGQTPSGTYTTWDTAASNIQDAVNVAAAGDTVLVSNGVYNAGSTVNGRVDISLTNFTFMAVSTNPYDTIIDGGGTNRCIYVSVRDVTIRNFLITNGSVANHGGGVRHDSSSTSKPLVLTNCVITGNRVTVNDRYGAGAFAYYANTMILRNCLIIGNVNFNSGQGGGVHQAILTNNCRVLHNSALTYGGGVSMSTVYGGDIVSNSSRDYGGGAYLSTLYDVTLSNNTVNYRGGGAYNSGGYQAIRCFFYNNSQTSNNVDAGGGGMFGGVASNCVFGANHAFMRGGGACDAVLISCTVSANIADSEGGGTCGTALTNCLIANNTAGVWGSGTSSGQMVNCTIVSNVGLGASAAGIRSGSLTNCIVWGNYISGVGISNYNGSPVFSYCCTYPLPSAGADGGGNINTDPQFEDAGAGNYRLKANSPCVNTGKNSDWMMNAYDLDNRIRIRYGTVDMGAYETIYRGATYSVR